MSSSPHLHRRNSSAHELNAHNDERAVPDRTGKKDPISRRFRACCDYGSRHPWTSSGPLECMARRFLLLQIHRLLHSAALQDEASENPGSPRGDYPGFGGIWSLGIISPRFMQPKPMSASPRSRQHEVPLTQYSRSTSARTVLPGLRSRTAQRSARASTISSPRPLSVPSAGAVIPPGLAAGARPGLLDPLPHGERRLTCRCAHGSKVPPRSDVDPGPVTPPRVPGAVGGTTRSPPPAAGPRAGAGRTRRRRRPHPPIRRGPGWGPSAGRRRRRPTTGP